MRTWISRGTGAFVCGLLAAACGGNGGGGGDGDTASSGPAPGAGLDYSFDSLDVSAVGTQSDNWCEAPSFTPAGFVTLDQEALASLLGDYTAGWMNPLHESLLGLEEGALLDSIFETIFATYVRECDPTTDDELETLPPPELLDPKSQQDTRDEVGNFVRDATVVSEGETLRLQVHHQCERCDEPFGAAPTFVNAQLTEDGVIVLEWELSEGAPWTKKLLITPDAVVIQAPLTELSEWWKSIDQETRDGQRVWPELRGMVTAVARKDNAGGISSTLGISGFHLETEPGREDSITATMGDDCFGMHAGISGSTREAQAALHASSFDLTIPGQVNCNVPECGTEDRAQDWHYSLGEVSLTAEQPNQGTSSDNLILNISTDRAAKALVGENAFAEGGLGRDGKGGQLSLNVDKREDGFLVTFNKPLNVGGAMTISSFSDEMNMKLPEWLADEIFDVTFGGDPKSSVFVPRRNECPAGIYRGEPGYPEPVDRRFIHVESGEFVATRTSGGNLTATAGQCVTRNLAPSDTFVQTSDWVESGVACE